MKGKKILSLFLSFVMVISVVAGLDITTAFAETSEDGDWTYTISDDGTAVITAYNGSDTEITIPATVDGYTVTEVSFSSNSGSNSTIISITISEGITTLSAYAFSSCTALGSVEVSSTITEIPDYCFYACSRLSYVIIRGSNLISVGKSAFAGCMSLKYIVHGEGLISIGDGAFASSSLEEIIFPETLETIGSSAFTEPDDAEVGSITVTSIRIPSSVTSIGHFAFNFCNLEEVIILSENAIMDQTSFYSENLKTIISISEGTISNDYPAVSPCMSEDAVIYGISGSSLNEFATEYDITFVAIDYVTTGVSCKEDKVLTITVSEEADADVLEELGLSVGDVVYEEVVEEATKNHQGDTITVSERESFPTCTEDGIAYDIFYCSACGQEAGRITYTNFALGHDYVATVTDPTCTEEGYTTYVCSRCDDTYVDDYVDATGHSYSWTLVSKKPTKMCSSCDDVLVTIPFTDLTDTSYSSYYDRIAYLSCYNSFINGTSSTTYSPTKALTRAAALTILYRMAGSPYDDANPYTSSPFTDVKTTAYYYNAACWALDNGITTNTTFKGSSSATRQETVTFLYRYVSYCTDVEITTKSISSFSDASSVSSWAKTAMQWAYANGLITGNSSGKLNPTGVTYRIYASKIYYQFGVTCSIGNFE